MRGKEVEGKNGEQVRGGDDDEETRGRQKYKLGRTGRERQEKIGSIVKMLKEDRKDGWKGKTQGVSGGRRGGGGGGPSEGGAPSYCGRAFRMAFTSSATAVNANSNWSCGETKAGNKREEES